MEIQIAVLEGPASGQTFSFDRPDCFLFGRSADAKVSLPADGYVSRQHFLLTVSPPTCRITDLGSKNGTHVNGVRYGGRKPPAPGVQLAPAGQTSTELGDSDVIVVGDTRMEVSILTDAVCNRCRDIIAHDIKASCALPAGGYQCVTCRAPNQPAMPVETLSKIYTLGCARCGRDVTEEAGSLGQAAGSEFVCSSCRAAPSIPATALAQTGAVPGAPNVPGYTIDRELGRGGMGAVYRATTADGRTVAIKTLLPHVAMHPDHVKMFGREVDVTRQLHHPNVVELIDHGKVDGTLYCVLEFVDGQDLHALINQRNGRVPLAEAVPLMLEILEGLGYAHTAPLQVELPTAGVRSVTGIVHRDLKPQNILLGRRGQGWVPKVADFGLSKAFESAGLSSFTAHGEVAGTPMYWPREQITHYRYLHPATDVFSIAAVFYEMLTGAPVRDSFDSMLQACQQRRVSPGLADFAMAILGNPTIPIQRRNPDIPPRLAAVIDRALGESEVPQDPDAMRRALSELRYPHAGAFRAAIVQALQ